MFGWAALDVAIGLFFMYLLLSMVGTAVQEAIASLLKLRASNLFEGITNLLNDEKLTTSEEIKDLASAVYNHPAIKSLYRPDRKIFGLGKIFGKKLESGPSYIPSRTFVMALLDTIRRQYATKDGGNAQTDGKAANTVANIGADELFRDAKAILSKMPDCDLKAQLMLLAGDIPDHAADLQKLKKDEFEELEKKVTEAVERLESWFNDSMARIAGWYKRKAKSIAIVVGISMAVLLNADTIHVATTLWTDSGLRVSLSEGAVAYLENASSEPETKKLLTETLEELSQYNLPIGWRVEAATNNWGVPISLQEGQRGWVAVIGWLITGFALSLGAGFWFDMLSKVVSLRGSGAQISTQTGKAVDKTPQKPIPPAAGASE